MPCWSITNSRSYTTYPDYCSTYILYHLGHIMFMFIMKHLCVVCALDCVMAAFLKPKKLEFKIRGCHYKSNCHLELNVFVVLILES